MHNKKYLTEKRFVIAIAVFCSILWGSAFPVLKVSYYELNIKPNDMFARITFAGMRFFLASILIFVITKFVAKQSILTSKNNLLKLLILGILQTALFYFVFYTGVANTTGIKAAILDSGASFFVVLLAHYIYTDDKIDKRKIVGLIAGFGGIIFVNRGKSLDLNFTLFGEGFMLISGFIFAVSTIVAKKICSGIHPFIVTGWQMFFGSIILLTIGIPKVEHSIMFTPKTWGLLLYASCISATAFSLWYSLLKYNKAGEISIYKFVNPIAGSILSTIFIPGEKFSFNIVIGLMLVVFGIIAINYTPKYFIKEDIHL